MMTKICGWILAITCAWALSSPAFAAQAKRGRTAEDRFKALDKNNDNKVSREEYVGLKEGEAKDKAVKAFKKLDKNGDGSLTLAEYKASGNKKAAKKGKK